MSRKLLQELVAENNKTYSRQAVFEEVDRVGIYAVIGCVDSKYSAWKYFVPLPPDGTALVFETGLGIDTLAIAPHVKKTIVVCPSRKIAKIIQSRIDRTAEADNISLIVAGFAEFPFARSKFNLIADRSFSDRFDNTDKWTSCRTSLEEIKYLLTDDGKALIGTDYYSLWKPRDYFIGILKYQNNWLCSLFLAVKYWRDRNVFCGMSDHYLFDEFIVRLKNYHRRNPDSSLKEYVKNRIINVLFPVGSSSAYYIVRKKNNISQSKTSLFERILAAFPAELCGSKKNELLVHRIIVGNPGTLLCCITTGKHSFVLRIPIIQDAVKRTKQQIDTLHLLQSERFKLMGIPKIFPSYSVDGQDVFIEEKLDGIVVEDKQVLQRAHENKAVNWITKFHLMTANNDNVHLAQLYRDLQNTFDCLARKVRTGHDTVRVNRLKEKVLSTYADAVTGTVCMHGDYKIENTIFSPDMKKINGVFDWDLSMRWGFPLVDLYYFIAYSTYLQDSSTTIAELLTDKFFSGILAQHEEEWISVYMLSLDINTIHRHFYVIVTWLYHLVYRVPTFRFSSPVFYNTSVHRVLAKLVNANLINGETAG